MPNFFYVYMFQFTHVCLDVNGSTDNQELRAANSSVDCLPREPGHPHLDQKRGKNTEEGSEEANSQA